MAITVIAAPTVLAWNLFTEVDSLPSGEDAHTKLKYDLQNKNFKHASGVYSFPDATLTVSPIVRVLTSAKKTADLLSHEQGHYNIGILVGRAMAREIESLSDKSPAKLAKAITAAFDNHSLKLMDLVQKAYDKDTEHSKSGTGQTRWDSLIAAALASKTAVDKLNMLPL